MSGTPSLQWSVYTFAALGTQLLHDILRLRVDVFVVEQNCPYPELDGLDLNAIHVVGREADGEVIAYARILPPGADARPHIGRVVVARAHRREGHGKHLMENALREVEARYGNRRSALAAQAYLKEFYAGFGYVTVGPEYLLDGIPHVDMFMEEATTA